MKGVILTGGGGTPLTITFIDDRPGDDRRCATGASKIENQLGWRPQQRLETGPVRTAARYFDKEWWEPIREKTYAGGRPGRLVAGQ
jgi:dTDP-glucose 4,6-dehydratase